MILIVNHRNNDISTKLTLSQGKKSLLVVNIRIIVDFGPK